MLEEGAVARISPAMAECKTVAPSRTVQAKSTRAVWGVSPPNHEQGWRLAACRVHPALFGGGSLSHPNGRIPAIRDLSQVSFGQMDGRQGAVLIPYKVNKGTSTRTSSPSTVRRPPSPELPLPCHRHPCLLLSFQFEVGFRQRLQIGIVPSEPLDAK